MTQTLLAIILQRILLNRVQEENVKIVYNQKVILRMSYNYSYVFVCIKLQINDSIQVIFAVVHFVTEKFSQDQLCTLHDTHADTPINL